MTLVVALLIVALLVPLAAALWAGRDRLRKPRMVRLHLRDPKAPTLDGILLGVQAGHYRLGNVTHLETADRSHALDGEAWVPVDRVLYLQVTG